jgi:hypothetical protein
VGVGDLGTVLLTGAGGPDTSDRDVVVSVDSARARVRRVRWPEAEPFVTVTRTAPLHPIVGEPDLEAHLAGWR